MTVDELGRQTKAKHAEYGNYPDAEVGARVLAKYPQYRSQISSDFSQTREKIEPGIMGETSPTGQRLLENAGIAGGGYGVSQLAGIAGKAAIGGAGKIIGKIKSIRNAPKTLEEALGTIGEKFGTSETPSMAGNASRAGLESESSLNEVLAQKLYGEVPKDIPVSTPRLSTKYQEIADELPASLGNAIKKHIQLEPNPIRPGDIGTGNTSAQYAAFPGTPTQLPPTRPPVGDLIKLRSKLGAASRSGGIDGYNAGQLKSVLDEDIANLGAGEGPLGKMTQQVVNEPLKRATNYYREMMQQQGTPLYKKLSTGKVDDIPKIIFNKGSTRDVLEARAILGDAGFKPAKKMFFNEIINSKDIGKTLSKYGKNNSDFLSAVFNSEELGSLKTVATLQQKATDAAKTATRVKMLLTGAGAVAIGGGVAGQALKIGMGGK